MRFDPMLDSREAFTAEEEASYYADLDAGNDIPEDMGDFDIDEREFEDDGQPSEYDEWQDFNGGDDWDQGQWDGNEEYDDYQNSYGGE
jgi:hypothetical protein